MKILVFTFLLLTFFKQSCDGLKKTGKLVNQSINFVDESRNRQIPVQLYYNPKNINKKVVIINPGYQAENTAYSFFAEKLVEKGYTVISILHDLPTDEPIATSGNIYELRMPAWERGVENVQYVVKEMRQKYPDLQYQNLVLIGHSMGGDISMLFAKKYPEQVSAVISLDHRRMPIPRISKPHFLSIRAEEFQADSGVLPNEIEQAQFGIKIVTLKNTKHADFSNVGSLETKQNVSNLILNFLDENK
jgi:pimeloyl-ACP methyl ester carboxylesterase